MPPPRGCCGRRCGADRSTSWPGRPGRGSMSEATNRACSMEDVLAQLRRRQRMRHAIDLLLRGVLYGAAAAAVIAAVGIASRAGWVHGIPWRVLWAIPAVAAGGALVGLLRHVD